MNSAVSLRDLTHSAPGSEGDEIDVRQLFGIFVANRVLLLAIVTGALFLAAFYAWTAPRIYQADALVQVEVNDKKSIDAALGDIAELLGNKTPVTAEMEILKSRLLLGKVIQDLKLDIVAKPVYFPVIGEAIARNFAPTPPRPLAGAWLGLHRFAWGGEKIAVTSFEIPAKLYDKRFTLIAEAEDRYQLVAPDGETLGEGRVGEPGKFPVAGGMVELFVQNLTADIGTHFNVRRLSNIDLIHSLEEEIRVTEQGKQSGILSLSFESRDAKQAVDTLNSLASNYLRQNVERKSAEAQQTLDFLDTQLPKLKHELEAAENALNQHRLKEGSVDMTKETELVLQQAVTLEQSRVELQQKREEAIRRFTPNHPVIQGIDAQLARISVEKNTITARVKDLPAAQQELLSLKRDVEVDTRLYNALLNNAQQLQVAKAGTVGNVRVIDYAVLPNKPVKPKILLILALGLILGGILGLGVIFVRRALNSGVSDPAVVERILGLPTYGAIPFSAEQKRMFRDLKRGKAAFDIIAYTDPQGLVAEAIRSLRTSLHFAQMDAHNNILMLTGPSPDLGKSFVSINLGASLAAAGKRVLVVDADMRRGHLHEFTGGLRTPGLSDLIAGDKTLDQVISTTPVAGLFLLSTGTIPPNPAELIIKEKTADLFAQFSKQFDHVIIDTPPILAVTDAMLIGRFAATTLLVLKSGEHSVRMIEDAVKRLRNAGIEPRGTVFNQIGMMGSGYGYSYGYYQYSYGPIDKAAKS